MIEYDVIRYDLMCCNMLWYDVMIWYDRKGFYIMFYDILQNGKLWYDMFWYKMYDAMWYDMI